MLVANVDSSTDDTTALMRLLVKRVTPPSSERIVAVVGWPDESDTRAASDVLAAAGMPLIAPGPAISGFGSQTYFALAPSIAEQGTALAEAAATVLNSQRILVARDPNDAQSSALALAFAAQVQQHFSSLLIARQDAFTVAQTTDFSQVVGDAAANGVDTIVLAGRDVDVTHLAQAVATGDFYGRPRPYILTSAVALTTALLGIGSSPVAQLTRSHAAALSVVRAEALAAHGGWSAAGVPEGQQPSFFVDYQQQFAPGTSAAAVASPDALAILSYDAVRLATTAVGRASHGASSPADVPADVLAGLRMVRPSAPFQGVGGSIAFSGSGAPVAKALALVELTPVPNAPPAGAALQSAVIALLGGTAGFCAGVTCAP